MEIYQLTDLQHKILQASAESGASAFFFEPNPLGSYDEQDKAKAEMKGALDLVRLELFVEVSNNHTEVIDKFKEEHGFGLRFFKATELAGKMFKKPYTVIN